MSAQAINKTNGMHQQQHGNPQLQQQQQQQPAPNNYPNNIKSNTEQAQPHQQQQSQPQPSVRHIPIFVEGRDEPLINKNIDTSTKNASSQYQQQQQQQQQHQQPPHQNDLPNSKSSGGIFDRVKNFPTISRMQSTYANRSNSPNRSVPVNVQRSTSATRNNYQHSSGPNNDNVSRWSDQQQQQLPPQQQQQQQPQYQQQYNQNQYSQNYQPYQQKQQMPTQTTAASAAAAATGGYGFPQQQQQRSTPDADSITKIQNIQCDVLNLMDEVEKFNGCSRKDRQYLYLDEMLTQNLLKLDTIDADGKENIKQARREAIKCINTCIAVLEAKADSAQVHKIDNGTLGGNNSAQQQQQQYQQQQQQYHQQQQQQQYNQNRQ